MKKCNSPFFSVVIPAYNIEAYIDDAILSVTSQDFTNFEILVVDDGSEDGTVEKCRRLACGDKRIQVFSEPHQGISGSRNTAIRRASGRYLVFLDGDDRIFPGAFRRLAEELLQSEDRNEAVVLAHVICTINDGKDSEKKICVGQNQFRAPEDYLKLFQHTGINLYSPVQYIADREWFIRNNLFFQFGFAHEDYFWTPDLLITADKLFLAHSFPFYEINRRRADSFTRVLKLQKLKDIFTLFDLFWNKHPYLGVDASELERLLRSRMTGSIFSAIGRYVFCETIPLRELTELVVAHREKLTCAETSRQKQVLRCMKLLDVPLTLWLLRKLRYLRKSHVVI